MGNNDIDWDDDGDGSFMSALVASPLAESLTSYSICVNPLSLNIDNSDHSEYEDALSEGEETVDDLISTDNLNDKIDKPSFDNPLSLKNHAIDPNEPKEYINNNEEITPLRPKRDEQKASQKNVTISARPSVMSLTFNQDNDCIAMATSIGFQIITLDPNPNESYQIHKKDIKGGIKCIQILHRTSLVAMVKVKTPRILTIAHAKTGEIVQEFPFTSAVRRIEMNKLCLVILTALGNLHVFVYNRHNGNILFLQNINILTEVESARMMTTEEAMMQGAFFDLSSLLIEGCAWLVSKSSEGLGVTSVYKICSNSTEKIKSCNAHSHSIVQVSIGGKLNSSNALTKTVFATASSQGTIIRVFRMFDCMKLFVLQRGSSPSSIRSISFNIDASTIAVSSSRGTIHIFNLTAENQTTFRGSVPSKNNPLKALRMPFSGQEKKEKMIRSFARVRLRGEHTSVPNTVKMLKTISSVEENVVVCLKDGKVFQYGVRSNGRKRPTRADDLMIQKNE